MTLLDRRAALGLLATLPITAQAQSDTYPDKIIRVVIPFAAGGPNDVVGRPLFEKMSEALGQPIIIENRPGAQGRTATLAVAKSPADGYTVLMTTGSHVANLALYTSLPYDPLTDFIGITQIAESYGLAMVARPNLPANTLQELVALAKASPGKFNFGHPGVGNANHIAGEIFQKLAGVHLLPVPYRGSGSYVQDVISSQIDLAWASTALITPNARSGLLKVLATTGAKRAPTLPDVPTMQELGYKEFDWNGYYGLYVPTGTPKERVDKLHAAAVRALTSDQMKRVLSDSGLISVGSSPAEFARYLEKDLAHQRAVIKLIGLQPQQ